MSAAVGPQTFLQGSDVECRQDQNVDEVSPSLIVGTGVSAVPLLGAAGVFDKTVKAMSSKWMDTFVWPDRRGPQVKQVWVRERAALRQEA
jgi:hypothetical protein